MLELFGLYTALENYSNLDSFKEGYDINYFPKSIPVSWIIIALIISFGTAYIAYSCNQFEKPATRALSTIIGFFFSGFYLIYYFIVHVLFDRKCGSRGINNIVMNIVKK
jgi:magnesium-transporting ATPase (P-type)